MMRITGELGMSDHGGLCQTIARALVLTLSGWGVMEDSAQSRREKEESRMILKFWLL